MFPNSPTSSLPAVLTALIVACSKPIDPGTPIALGGQAASLERASPLFVPNNRPATAAEPSAVALGRASSDAGEGSVFNRQDFIERSRAFVPVYVDGDAPGAQKLGARFNVSGHPTMLLFSQQDTELTRLPGEVDAARYTEVLTLGMNARHPVKDVLTRAASTSRDVQAHAQP